jgi:hypothetical protein
MKLTLVDDNQNAQTCQTAQAPQAWFYDYLPGILDERLPHEQHGYEAQSAVDGEHPLEHGEEAVKGYGEAARRLCQREREVRRNLALRWEERMARNLTIYVLTDVGFLLQSQPIALELSLIHRRSMSAVSGYADLFCGGCCI